ncbi:hypothetical protein [Paenibacillus xylanexedens]|uniref:Uncharacterized protein n=1 Tax=Paenibacillus xylanexedens TaxID=528191 RepID=A0ABS4RWN0_PAEXY|nr:hypothetical protein [Paenibacillus xylanexedens]MBP2247159.1 hypothetical protein [Paenibacillus xylanexedens]
MPGIDSYSMDNYGLDGFDRSESKPFITGVAISSSQFTMDIVDRGGNTITSKRSFIQITGLPFRPKKVILRNPSSQGILLTYDANSRNAVPNASGTNFNLVYDLNDSSTSSTGVWRVFEYSNDTVITTSPNITEHGFCLPTNGAVSTSWVWEAYGEY